MTQSLIQCYECEAHFVAYKDNIIQHSAAECINSGMMLRSKPSDQVVFSAISDSLIDVIADKMANGWDYGTHPREKARIVLEAIRQHQVAGGEMVERVADAIKSSMVNGKDTAGFPCDHSRLFFDSWFIKAAKAAIAVINMGASGYKASGDTSPGSATRKNAEPEAPTSDIYTNSPVSIHDGPTCIETDEKQGEEVSASDYTTIDHEAKQGASCPSASTVSDHIEQPLEMVSSEILVVDLPGEKTLIDEMQQAWLDAFPINDHCSPIVSYAAMKGVYDEIRPYFATQKPVIDKALENAAEILANLKNEGERTKLEEWQACYAMLFKQMNDLVASTRKPVSVKQICFKLLGPMPCLGELVTMRERVEAVLDAAGVKYGD